MVVAILKNLQEKNYYKRTVVLNPQLLVSIAENTFGMQISIDTVKSRSKGKKLSLDFIPVAS